MKKDEVPQDLGSLGKITKEVCYVTDAQGNYTTELSNGWEVKTNALDVTWDDIEHKTAAAKEKVLKQQASALLFFMEKNVMNLSILSAYTGFYTWQIKRHLKPEVFKKLSFKKLSKYANAFNITVDELKNMKLKNE